MDIQDVNGMTQASNTGTESPRPEVNVCMLRFHKISATARAARAASRAAMECVAAERDVLAGFTGSWRGYLRGMDPHKLPLADALINPDAPPALRAKALASSVARRFPYGLADQIRAHRARLAALEVEAQPAAERAQQLGELVDGLTEYLRGLGMVKPDFSRPTLQDGAGGGAARPEALSQFGAATATHNSPGGN